MKRIVTQTVKWKFKLEVIAGILGVILMIIFCFLAVHYKSEVNKLTAINDELINAGAKSDNESAADENKLEKVVAENKNFSYQITQLKSQVSQLESQLGEAQTALTEPEDLEEQIINSLTPSDDSAATETSVPTPTTPTDRNRNRWQNMSVEERAQFETRMREGMDRMRNRQAEDLNAEMMKTSDPTVQDRLTQIQQYSDYNMDRRNLPSFHCYF